MTPTTWSRGRTGLALSLIAALLLAVPVQRARANSIRTPLVLPPSTHPYGMTYGQWSAAWWQYVGSIPVPENPLYDLTGADCGVGQSGPVWFLVGTFDASGTATRTCTIPAGKALFFPILNGLFCCPAPSPSAAITATLKANGNLRALGQSTLTDATNLSAEVDGTPIPGLSTPVTIYHALSPVFTLTVPDNNIFGLPAGTSLSVVADGFYLMLAPLPAGQHTVHFHGENPTVSPPFTLDITYHLTVLSS